jgi:hypothetical protein
MSEHIDLVVGALDSLGVALADHGHEWTDGERAIYEESIKTLWNMADEWKQLRQQLAAEREQRNEIERSRDSWYQIATDEREKFGRLMGAIQAHYGNMDKESAERLQNLIDALEKMKDKPVQLPMINEDPVIELK